MKSSQQVERVTRIVVRALSRKLDPRRMTVITADVISFLYEAARERDLPSDAVLALDRFVRPKDFDKMEWRPILADDPDVTDDDIRALLKINRADARKEKDPHRRKFILYPTKYLGRWVSKRAVKADPHHPEDDIWHPDWNVDVPLSAEQAREHQEIIRRARYTVAALLRCVENEQPADDGWTPKHDTAAYSALKALYELGACSRSSCKSSTELAHKGGGPAGNPDTFKGGATELKSHGLAGAASGSGGGYWLTERGLARARKVFAQQPPIAP